MIYLRAAVGAISPKRRSVTQRAASEFYALSAKTLAGEEFNFASLQSKVVLILNVASN